MHIWLWYRFYHRYQQLSYVCFCLAWQLKGLELFREIKCIPLMFCFLVSLDFGNYSVAIIQVSRWFLENVMAMDWVQEEATVTSLVEEGKSFNLNFINKIKYFSVHTRWNLLSIINLSFFVSWIEIIWKIIGHNLKNIRVKRICAWWKFQIGYHVTNYTNCKKTISQLCHQELCNDRQTMLLLGGGGYPSLSIAEKSSPTVELQLKTRRLCVKKDIEKI